MPLFIISGHGNCFTGAKDLLNFGFCRVSYPSSSATLTLRGGRRWFGSVTVGVCLVACSCQCSCFWACPATGFPTLRCGGCGDALADFAAAFSTTLHFVPGVFLLPIYLGATYSYVRPMRGIFLLMFEEYPLPQIPKDTPSLGWRHSRDACAVLEFQSGNAILAQVQGTCLG